MSGLSFLSKLVERIVAAQIRSHMDSHGLGNTFQSAYKVGHSTETALCIKVEDRMAKDQHKRKSKSSGSTAKKLSSFLKDNCK